MLVSFSFCQNEQEELGFEQLVCEHIKKSLININFNSKCKDCCLKQVMNVRVNNPKNDNRCICEAISNDRRNSLVNTMAQARFSQLE